ncbi:MAG: cofactor-independent phosphoglycerate mutase [bacterium]
MSKQSAIKYILLVGDGMADYPIPELGNKTPLEAASTPNMDRLAAEGMIGTVRTLREGLPLGSDVANLTLLGYEPAQYYTGRGPLEAANMGIDLGKDETAARCNLVTIKDNLLLDYSAGHISSQEAGELIDVLNERLGSSQKRFYPGVSYRHLLVLKGDFTSVEAVPPHDIIGRPYREYLPGGKGAEVFRELMAASYQILKDHPLNQSRDKPANMIWLWGQGKAPTLPTLKERFGISGVVVAAVDLVKGLGRYAGLEVIDVPGVTGYLDTNYEGKVAAGLEALNQADFLFLHVEAPDEAGHSGVLKTKIEAIEAFDARIVGPVLKGLSNYKEYRVLLMPDHLTPLSVRTHTVEPVPFCLFGFGIKPDEAKAFNETEAQKGSVHLEQGWELITRFLGGE